MIRKERRVIIWAARFKLFRILPMKLNIALSKVLVNVDVALVEIGGTVGDIESLPFLEAIRQMRMELGRQNTLFIHLTLVPYIPTAGEIKTKPTQHSVKELRSIGIQPDILICRCERPISENARSKIALFTNVEERSSHSHCWMLILFIKFRLLCMNKV